MSVPVIPNGTYLFIIDTDQYAGNFERWVTGYITGRHDDTHGDIEAKAFHDDPTIPQALKNEFNSLVMYVPGENGYDRVCSIWPTPLRRNDGYGTNYSVEDDTVRGYPAYESVAIFFCRKPSDEAIQLMKDRADSYGKLPVGTYPKDKFGSMFNILNYRLVKVSTVTTYEDII